MFFKDKIKNFLVFLAFFIVFFIIQLSISGFFSFDDPYYHAKHSALMVETGNLTLIRPWLKFHFLNYAPTDPWWGFHLAQALFIKFFNIIIGTKILSSILAALVFAVFYFILKKQSVRSPLLWTGLYFSTSALLLNRLLLERPFLLALSVLPLTFYYCSRKKYFYLFLLSLFYALFYNQAPLAVLLAVTYSTVQYFTKKIADLKIIIFSAAGLMAGFLFHPHSLNYIYIVAVIFFQIIFLKFAGVDLSVGSEIQTPGFSYFLAANFLAVIFYLLAVVIFWSIKEIRSGEKAAVNYFLFLYSFFWFFVTLILPRGVEYWLPLGWIFIAFIFNDFYGSSEYTEIKNFLVNRLNLKVLTFFAAGFLTVIIFYNYSTVYLSIYSQNRDSWPADLAQANDWLKTNTSAGSMVFYNNWGMWPLMFYYNDHNQYVVGIDPTFLYEYDHQLFWLWKNISYYGLYCDRQETCFDASPRDNAKLIKMAIKEKFQADYVLLANNPDQPLAKFLASNKKDFFRVFENEKVLIYEVK
ncbi:MAG: hypothetical protein HYV53_03055 [Parcubacteria group bacterium]|nr:hypothetical protein [Parcubacteria group bacterium]